MSIKDNSYPYTLIFYTYPELLRVHWQAPEDDIYNITPSIVQ